MCSRCVSFLIAAAILCGGVGCQRGYVTFGVWGLGFGVLVGHILCTQYKYIHVSWLLLYVKWYFQLI